MITVDSELLDILACPKCKSPLRADNAADELVCTSSDCGLAYPVRDDIPVLLIDEARAPEAAIGSSPEADSTAAASSEEDSGPAST